MTHRTLAFYVGRRFLAFVVVLVAVSFAVFSLQSLAPGSVVDTLLGGQEAGVAGDRDPATVAALREQYHLDEPFLTRYWLWARDAAQLEFGTSTQSTLPVTDEIKARLPVSLMLGIYAFILTMTIGVGFGIIAALRRRGVVDRAIVATSVVGLSTPVFVSGVILLYLFAIVVPIFPSFGRGDGFVDQVWHNTLPAFALAGLSAWVLKHTRASMITVLDEDYVTFARARGLSPRRILFGYVLRNALIPVVTIAGLIFGGLVIGAVLVESTFSLPGLGSLLVQSAGARDVPMLQGVAMLIAAVILTISLVVDLLYVILDPRIRLGRQGAS